LRIAGLNVPADLTAKYPHLYGSTHLELDEQHIKRVRNAHSTPHPTHTHTGMLQCFICLILLSSPKFHLIPHTDARCGSQ